MIFKRRGGNRATLVAGLTDGRFSITMDPSTGRIKKKTREREREREKICEVTFDTNPAHSGLVLFSCIIFLFFRAGQVGRIFF